MDIGAWKSVSKWLIHTSIRLIEQDKPYGIRTTMSLFIPNSSQRMLGSNFLMRKSVLWLPGPSRFSGIASHL